MAEAARITGLSVSTLRRRRDALTEHGATRHDGAWSIPLSSLVTLGLMPRVTPPDTPSNDHLTPVMTPPGDEALDALKAERDQALQQAADAERRAEVAERIAAERDRVIEAQSHALRLLEPGRRSQAKPEAYTSPIRDDRADTASRRSFLKRLRRK